MQIEKGQGLSLVNSSATGTNGHHAVSQTNNQDVNWFRAALDPHPDNPRPRANPQSWITPLSEISSEMNRQSHQVDRALSKAALSGDQRVVMNANRLQSSYYLQGLMNAKVVSKFTQGLEKLTNQS